MGYKYVILKSRGFAYPVIFPDKLVHSDVADLLIEHLKTVHKDPNATILSGGKLDLDMVFCSHGSETLNIVKDHDASVRDVHIIERFDTNHGILEENK